MFKEMLDTAFPILQKLAPSIASVLDCTTTPALLVIRTVLLLSEVFKPEQDNFSIEDIKNWILLHPDSEKLIKLAEENMKVVLASLDNDKDHKLN